MASSGTQTAHRVAWALVIIGGINWGLIGFFGFNLVAELLGSVPTLERVVYAIVGLAAVYLLVMKAQSSGRI